MTIDETERGLMALHSNSHTPFVALETESTNRDIFKLFFLLLHFPPVSCLYQCIPQFIPLLLHPSLPLSLHLSTLPLALTPSLPLPLPLTPSLPLPLPLTSSLHLSIPPPPPPPPCSGCQRHTHLPTFP